MRRIRICRSNRILRLLLLVCACIGAVGAIGAAADRTIIGRVEYVLMQDVGLKLKARIDTGAGVSSINAKVLRFEPIEKSDETIRKAASFSNDGEGIRFDERSSGTLVASVEKSSSSENDDAGIRASDENPDNTSTLSVKKVTLVGNDTAYDLAAGVTLVEQ